MENRFAGSSYLTKTTGVSVLRLFFFSYDPIIVGKIPTTAAIIAAQNAMMATYNSILCFNGILLGGIVTTKKRHINKLYIATVSKSLLTVLGTLPASGYGKCRLVESRLPTRLGQPCGLPTLPTASTT